MNFIELTKENGMKFIGNVNLLERVVEQEKGCYVIGWNNNGGFLVRESYEEIIQKITTSFTSKIPILK